jgi:hypothetical protein
LNAILPLRTRHDEADTFLVEGVESNHDSPQMAAQLRAAGWGQAFPEQSDAIIMWSLIVAAICAGLFAGAAIYINAVEHPARLSCGNDLAVREFAPSYRRATVLQASLAMVGCVVGLWSAWVLKDAWIAVGALLLGAVVPFTLIVILPTNTQLLEPSLDAKSARATELLRRWGRLHAIRSLLSTIAFMLFLVRLAG